MSCFLRSKASRWKFVCECIAGWLCVYLDTVFRYSFPSCSAMYMPQKWKQFWCWQGKNWYIIYNMQYIYKVFRCMLCMQWNFRGKQQQPPPVIGFENSVCNLEAMLVKKIHMIYVNLSNKCKNIIKDITSLDALEGHHSGWKCSLPSFNRPNALWLRSC